MRRRYTAPFLIDNFVSSTESFDEFYQTKFRNDMIDNGDLANAERKKTMGDIVGISQDELEIIL